MDRDKIIVKTSVIGILVNLVLVAFKASIGIMVNSIAITLDAVNNLTDALSSIITIIGTKLAGKAPDKEHPYGYGRIEYFSSVIISVIVLLAGITALEESVPKIFNPVLADYTFVSIFIIAVAVVVKFLLGRYVKGKGKEINSQSLVASGSDALFDAILSLSTVVAAIISLIWNISLEGILGTIIAFVIIKAAIEMLSETLSSMIGTRVDNEITGKLKERIGEFEEVKGVYDLTLHNYGPTQLMGSVHVEVSDDLTAKEIHKLTRQILYRVYEEFGIVLTVGIYASNVDTPESMEIKEDLLKIIGKYPEILQMHGFYIDEDINLITFDIILGINIRIINLMQSWMRTIVISQCTGMQKDQQVLKSNSNSFQILLFFY